MNSKGCVQLFGFTSGLVPTFNPSFKLINKKRIYDLLPDKITLVKYNGTIPADSVVGGDDTGGSGNTGGTDEQPPLLDGDENGGSDSGSGSSSGSEDDFVIES